MVRTLSTLGKSVSSLTSTLSRHTLSDSILAGFPSIPAAAACTYPVVLKGPISVETVHDALWYIKRAGGWRRFLKVVGHPSSAQLATNNLQFTPILCVKYVAWQTRTC